MEYRIGVTDPEWYKCLRQLNPPPQFVNYWRMTNRDPDMYNGQLFLFRLRSGSQIEELGISGKRGNRTDNGLYYVGGAYFSEWKRLTISEAWTKYKTANGVSSLESFVSLIRSNIERDTNTTNENRNITPNDVDEQTVILCHILRDPFFLATPFKSSYRITRGQPVPKAHTEDEGGMIVYQKVLQQLLAIPEETVAGSMEMPIKSENEQRYIVCEAKRRIGQEEFRKRLLDIYKNRCAITGDSVQPLLQAAHILPYAQGGSHDDSNGILLRADFHVLFDEGYITISPDYRVVVSNELTWLICIKDTTFPHKFIGTSRSTAFQSFSEHKLVPDDPGFERRIL